MTGERPLEHRSPVELKAASWSDPHMQPAAKHPRFVERIIALTFIAGLALFALFVVAYWQNWSAWTLGATMGAGMLFIGFGLVAWGKYLMPRGPFVEERHDLASSKEEVEAFTNALVERGGGTLQRRRVLGGLLAAGLGVFSLGTISLLVRSLGPLPKLTLTETDWKAGTYLVDQAGRRVTAGQLSVGSVLTVFPEGFQNTDNGQAVDQTILIRVKDTSFTTVEGRSTWAPLGYVAYSKLCTHLGCPVGLYEKELKLLVCPCHQSMFDVEEGAIPTFGPAPRPLPQLPLYVDSFGFLRAQRGYDQPVGPGYWERTT